MTRDTNAAREDSARFDPRDVTSATAAAVDPARLLDGCRQYLLMLANAGIGPELQAKVGASDLVQDTFVEAQRHLDVFRGKTDAEMRAWLSRILECQLANLRRAYLVTEKRAASRERTLNAGDDAAGAGIEAIKSDVPSPSNHAMRNEFNIALERALLQLPERYQRAIVLRHMEGLSWDEVASRMNCTAGAAHKVWSRAVELLRRQLSNFASAS